MTARVVKIGKQEWVAGLSWLSSEDVPSKAELLDDAEKFNSTWAAVRIGQDAIQAGFCPAIPGVKPSKVYSLAAMLADSQRQPWLGIFKIEEGLWWYIAVRDGHAILPDGDVIGGEEEIFAAREAHTSFTDWEYVDGDLSVLQAQLEKINAKPTRLKSLTGSELPTGLIAGAAAVAIGVAGGAYWWHAKQAEEQARLAAIKRFQAQMAAEKPQAKAPTAAPAAPAPADWLAACGNLIAPLPLSNYGWKLDQVGCDANSVVIRWVSAVGASVAHHPAGEVSDQGDAIQQRISLPALKPRDGSDAVALSEAKLAAHAWAQSGGYSLSFTGVVQPAPMPGAPAPQAAAPAQVGVAIDMRVSPLQAATANQLSNLPGLRLFTMKSTEQGWHLEGVIYGR